MDRKLTPPHVPICRPMIATVDQYMQPKVFPENRGCRFGEGTRYDCRGNIAYTTPLSNYSPKASSLSTNRQNELFMKSKGLSEGFYT